MTAVLTAPPRTLRRDHPATATSSDRLLRPATTTAPGETTVRRLRAAPVARAVRSAPASTVRPPSIFAAALGAAFDDLHPRVQTRFGFDSSVGSWQLGHGTMDDVWHGGAWTVPFLALGAEHRVLFPDRGKQVPFTIANYAYRDGAGREVVTFLRRFDVGGTIRRFDAQMVHAPARGCIVDYLGAHQRLAVDLDAWVDAEGGMNLRSGEFRVAADRGGKAGRWRHLPDLVTGRATVREWWDEAIGRHRISVAVVNDRFGPLFGYTGSFDVTVRPTPAGGAPAAAKPVREDPRA